MRSFPVDPTTLMLLRGACQINPDSGHTELQSFLFFGAVEKSRTLVAGDEDYDGESMVGDVPVYEVEFKPGTEPWSETSVIVALIDEIERLREDSNPATGPKGGA